MEFLNVALIHTAAMLLTAFIIPGLKVDGPLGALGAVIALALLNTALWDAALFYHLPDSITQHTLLLLLANGALFWVVVKIMPGIEVEGCLPALIAPVVLTVVTYGVNHYGRQVDWRAVGAQAVEFLEGAKKELQQKRPQEKQ